MRLAGKVHGLVGVSPTRPARPGAGSRPFAGQSARWQRRGPWPASRRAAGCGHAVFDGVFNGQAVAVPAGGVQRIKALQLAAFDDHVLQDFVHRVADVDLAVGIRRAVVQDEFGRSLAGSPQLLVDALLVPVLGPLRLALGQVAAHGKGRIGHVQRGAVGAFGGSCLAFFGGAVADMKNLSRFKAKPRAGPGLEIQGEENRKGRCKWVKVMPGIKFGRAWSGAGFVRGRHRCRCVGRQKRRGHRRSLARCPG